MGNVSIYLPLEHLEKLNRITQATNSKRNTVVRVIFRQMPEDYLCNLVRMYQDQENEKISS